MFLQVIGRTSHQIKQLRRGLKDTMVWPLLHARADVIPLVLPRESDALYTPQMILERITWPTMRVEEDEDEEEQEECSLETKCRITGYLRRFSDNACTELKDLMTFWAGWEIPGKELQLQIVNSSFPKSSTCFEILLLPGHYTDYIAFERDIQACLSTTYTRFGLV
ncbi:hypothetical protein AOXY_G5065 [Acipenser oxyrinchus oxyrinchus]|uniref:HECT domain-containing protein n=1 Tax=Acipenser oxyrinchus oxyrinchus TaxID=40147 RepID=A0AAD8LP32_ACIOX|nr:hypothetical protein AOXY_G5065 [Acipenser oxyrinchus oxyrinchus]